LPPWRSMRRRLMRAKRAGARWLLPLFIRIAFRQTDSRATVATLPSALLLRLPAAVPIGVLNSGGRCHLSNDLQPVSRPAAAVRRNLAVTPTRRSCMSGKSRSFRFPVMPLLGPIWPI
jgi:hypothetical protein